MAAALDVRQAPRPPIEVAASSPPSSSTSRIAHSRQMSSLSMNTFGTVSQLNQPSEPLLPGGADHHVEPSQRPLHPRASYVGRPSAFVTVDDLLSRPRERGYWEGAHARRMRRWRLFTGILLSIMGTLSFDSLMAVG
jgi:hypothetical protein